MTILSITNYHITVFSVLPTVQIGTIILRFKLLILKIFFVNIFNQEMYEIVDIYITYKTFRILIITHYNFVVIDILFVFLIVLSNYTSLNRVSMKNVCFNITFFVPRNSYFDMSYNYWD